MFMNPETYVVTALSLFAFYGFVYYLDCRENAIRSKAEITQLPTQESMSAVSEAVADAQPETQGQPQAEPIVDLVNTNKPNGLIECDDTPVPYHHELWPSPRPINFVRVILEEDPSFKPNYRRLAHLKAVDILAHRADMSRREFLNTNPILYSERYMKGMNALRLLKDSIDTLENMLRKETRREDMRRIENGKNACPVY
jgi:hypothetical protein